MGKAKRRSPPPLIGSDAAERRGLLVVDLIAREAASEHVDVAETRLSAPDRVRAQRSRSLDRATIATLILGLLLTAGLAFGARNVHDRNESVLLRQRVREAGAVISTASQSLQLPLSSAAVLAESTNGNVDAFRRLAVPLVGNGSTYPSATLWKVGSLSPLATVGSPPEIVTQPPDSWRAFFDHTLATPGMSVYSMLNGTERRIGYAFATSGRGDRFIVYLEAALPKSRRLRVASDRAFSDLDYALYIGARPDANSLIASSVDQPPLGGRHASSTVPFGDTKLLLVMKPRHPLGGALMARLQWILLFSGIALTLGAALLVESLARRRKYAERLATELDIVAAENARLYEQEREIAQALQHSLLPEAVPQLVGVDIAGRFAAGTPGVEIGGDWYDVLKTGPERCMFVVGDVSGRGVRAGTIMAKLRYAARAYAATGDTPHGVLDKMSKLVDVRDGHFATVLCGEFDAAARRLVLANAGHLPAMLVHDGGVAPVAGVPGVPIGVSTRVPYASVTLELPPHGTLLAFTDGLVERRGECIDVGLDRVADCLRAEHATLDRLLDELLERLQDGADDDTAMLGLRWDL